MSTFFSPEDASPGENFKEDSNSTLPRQQKEIVTCLFSGIASFLFVVPATTSHSCLKVHSRRKRGKPLQTRNDDSNNSSVINTYKAELFIALEKLDVSAKTLKKVMESEHQTTELKKECRRRPSLRGLPQIKAEKVSAKEWVEVLSDDFRRLAIANEFVSAAVLDTQNYTDSLRNLSSALKKSLCYLEVLSDYNNLELSHDVSAAVVPRMYKNMTSQALRDRRNCVILRDIVGLVADMKKVYKVKKTGKKV